MKRITIIGTGYVGLVSGAGISDFGHQVVCADIDAEKIKFLHNGTSYLSHFDESIFNELAGSSQFNATSNPITLNQFNYNKYIYLFCFYNVSITIIV